MVKFRQLVSDKGLPAEAASGDNALAVALDDEEGDEWLSPKARATARETEEPETGRHNHLDFVDLTAAALADVLSDVPQLVGSNQNANVMLNRTQEVVRKTADVDWD